MAKRNTKRGTPAAAILSNGIRGWRPEPQVSITREQVDTLRAKAVASGDVITVGLCDNALRFWGGRASEAPKRMLADIIAFEAGLP